MVSARGCFSQFEPRAGHLRRQRRAAIGELKKPRHVQISHREEFDKSQDHNALQSHSNAECGVREKLGFARTLTLPNWRAHRLLNAECGLTGLRRQGLRGKIAFSVVPVGTCVLPASDPALKRRAIIGRPSGTGGGRELTRDPVARRPS